MSKQVDSVEAIQNALDKTLQDPYNKMANDSLVGAVRKYLPQLQEEMKQLRGAAKGYVAVIRHPDEETIVVTQGNIATFSVDYGGSIDIANAAEADAVDAFEMAAQHARDSESLPDGAVKDALAYAVEVLIETYGEYTGALDEEDRKTLADWLPKAPEVN